jgi:Xaa-Pro aminopeptidase
LDLLKSSSYRFPSTIQEANDLIRPLRLIKSEYEIAQLERAIEITGESLSEAFTRIPQLKQEHELAALIEFGFTSRGVQRLGFPSIVGSGLNTTYLHYGDNNSAIPRDGLVLMDVGAEWNMYSADISRTVPADGSFSNAQRDLYDLVLKAQEAAIASVAPGVPFREPHNVAVRVVTAGLVDLGFLDGNLDSLIAQREYRQFFMHGTSHWLGLDVHDAGGYSDTDGNPHTLQAGMVLTVEPGIYISESMESVPKRYRGMGIRIEDDVLVTADGHRVLSADIPKQVNEIEALMSGAKGLFRRGL